MVKRDLIGAHYGLRDWLSQRVTAIVMALYTLLFVVVVADMPGFDYANWKALWTAPLMRYATFLFMACLGLHAWVGVRNIFMDYIKPVGLRLVLHSMVILALVVYAAWAIQILWGA